MWLYVGEVGYDTQVANKISRFLFLLFSLTKWHHTKSLRVPQIAICNVKRT
jgi:hypothetical protein